MEETGNGDGRGLGVQAGHTRATVKGEAAVVGTRIQTKSWHRRHICLHHQIHISALLMPADPLATVINIFTEIMTSEI